MLYILNTALLLTACWLFYKLVLQNETYYQLKRAFMLVCIILSFLLPLVKVPAQFSIHNNIVVLKELNAVKTQKIQKQTQSFPQNTVFVKDNSITATSLKFIVKWLYWLYWFGVIALAINFLIQLLALLNQLYKAPVIKDGRYRIVEITGNKSPCSFANLIFINPAKYEWEIYSQILLHEKEHIKQAHSLDLIIGEMMLIFQWFNPFAWLYRKELENNLEFLTDDSVLKNPNIAKTDYQLSLLKVSIPNYSIRITGSYNQSLLKKRIMMMNAKQSNIHNIWKYFMLAPLLMIITCTLNEPVSALTNSAIAQSHTVSNILKAPPLKILSTNISVKSNLRNSDSIVNKGSNLNKSRFITQISDSGSSYINDLNAKDIIKIQGNGITESYVKSFLNMGYKYMTANDIIKIHGYGISVAYVKGFANLGYKNMTVNEILNLQGYGITPKYAKNLIRSGHENLSVADIILLYQNGITAKR